MHQSATPSPATRSRALGTIAENILRDSGLDCVGLYRLDPDAPGGMQGVVLGLPDAFSRAYAAHGASVDPVLARVRRQGTPASTVTVLGPRWSRSELYRRVSGRFGLAGFCVLPLYGPQALAGLLYLGTSTPDRLRHLGIEGLATLSPHACRASVGLATMPPRHRRLTPRQNEIAALVDRGLTNRQIAEELGTGPAAVHKHLKTLNRQFGTATRTAMAAAWRAGAH